MIMAVLFLPVLVFQREKFLPVILPREFLRRKNSWRKIKNPLDCEWVGIFSLPP